MRSIAAASSATIRIEGVDMCSTFRQMSIDPVKTQMSAILQRVALHRFLKETSGNVSRDFPERPYAGQ